MARIRTIKPEFPHSESMGRISRDARLCFVLLWTLADDEGRLRGNSRMLASLLFPYDEDATKKIPTWLDELERENSIARYAVDGDRYIEIRNWLKYQKIDKPSPSKLPAFVDGSPNPREPSPNPREGSSEEGKGREGRGGDSREAARTAGPTEAHRALAAKLGIDCDAEWASFWDRVDAKAKPWFTNAVAAFSGWLRMERKYAERDGRVLSLVPAKKRVVA